MPAQAPTVHLPVAIEQSGIFQNGNKQFRTKITYVDFRFISSVSF